MTTNMAIGSALYSRLGTVQYTYNVGGTVAVTGTLGTYDSMAGQGGAAPYVIFQLVTSLDEYTFGNNSGESFDFLVKAVSNRQYPSMQAYAIYEQAHAVLQDAPLSVNGSYMLRCRRTSRLPTTRDIDGYWHVGGFYRIDVWSS